MPPAVPANPVFGTFMPDSGPASACTSRDGMHVLKLQPGASAPAVADSGPASAYASRNGMHVLKLQPGASAFSLALPGSPIIAIVLETQCDT